MHQVNLQAISFAFAITVVASFGCTSGSNTQVVADSDSTPVEAADAEALKQKFTELQEAIRNSDTASAADLTKRLFPDEASLRKVVKDADAFSSIRAMHDEFASAPEEQLAELFATDPKQTQIRIYSASTEELVANEAGTTAANEFPGGAKSVAASIFRPEVRFFEVELVEPGDEHGTRFHLFFHDGRNWRMLGPIWQVL